jgi:ribonuclease HII
MSKIILGIDEVGRGPWAGPLVVGACVLGSAQIEGLRDSKKLSPKHREQLAHEIKSQAQALATGWVTSQEIDNLGLATALRLAAVRAKRKINCDFDEIIIDGTVKLIDDPRTITLPKADSLIQSVSAAAIVAKVARDIYMSKLAQIYPEYGFERNMGYGTPEHIKALTKYGVCPQHRRSFRPVAAVLGLKNQNPPKISHSIGCLAEDQAEQFLINQGHQIVARNWKTNLCEIDIVSIKNTTLYFSEVKYRRGAQTSDGLDAVDLKKERQMRLAAEIYLELNSGYSQHEAILSVISLTGDPPQIDNYLEDIDS